MSGLKLTRRDTARARAGGIGWCRLIPSWPLVVALAALLRALAQPRALLNDPDTYLHIAAGRWMLAHAALPLHDPFSYTMAGAPWAVPEWLAELALATVYQAAGWSGVVLLTAACFAAAAAIFTRLLLRRLDPLLSVILAALAIALTLGHLLARPHILALPLLVLWCGTLLAARDDGTAPPFRLLPVMTLWANLHGSFMFGLALSAFVAGEALWRPAPDSGRRGEARRWGLFVVLAVAAASLTPAGIDGLATPFRLIAMPALQTAFLEWRSPDFQQFQPLEIFLLGLIALGFSTGLKLPPSRLVLLLGLCHMALAHERHAELVAFVAPLALAGPLGPQIAARLRAAPGAPTGSALWRGAQRLAAPARVPALLASLVLAAAISLPFLLHPLVRGDGPVTPARALATAARLGLTGRVFNGERFGGYLVFRGIPSFIDGRIGMYGNAFLARAVAAEDGKPRSLLRLLDRYRIAWTLLPPQAGAVAVLDALPGWRRVYADADAVIHIRRAAPGSAISSADRAAPPRRQPGSAGRPPRAAARAARAAR